MDIRTVTVLGANGTMGCSVAAIFASFGDARVYLVSRSLEASQDAVGRAAKSVRAESITSNLIPADYSSLQECISQSELVFESVAEHLPSKLGVIAKVVPFLKPDALFCSGTSGLSITTLAEALPESNRSRCFGAHFFNPPYSMSLCELIPTEYSNPEVLDQLNDYLSSRLLRTTVPVKDTPAFLGNRIGFQFINHALQLAEEHRDSGGIDYIDSIFGPFTGRAMAPLTTADFVGLDVCKAIIDNVYENTDDLAHGTFLLPEFVQTLIDEGRLGRKTGGGLYRLIKQEDGRKQMMVYDIKSDSFREKMSFSFPFVQDMVASIRVGDYDKALASLVENRSPEAELCTQLLLEYVVYALHIARQIGGTVHAADDVMATGFNWCPPLAMVEAFQTVTGFRGLAKERLDASFIDQVDFDDLLYADVTSAYDYRRYFKGAR